MDELFAVPRETEREPIFMARIHTAPSSGHGAKLTLPGQAYYEFTVKECKRLDGAALAAGDMVLVARVSGTYVILGKIIT